MIYIGLTGWGDHPHLYTLETKNKLREYAAHFPIVEVDSAFYAIQPERNYEKWSKETPEQFSFIVKAYQGMTKHRNELEPFKSVEAMFDAFKLSIQPLMKTGKLKMVLFQFPPWFSCDKKNVQYLRDVKRLMGDIPVALEFRNRSWFSDRFINQTIQFMKNEGWIHSICDEPQAGITSVPTVLEATHNDSTLIRFHGRNVHGWNNQGQDNWRDVRFLYRYNEDELFEWIDKIRDLEKQTKDIFILFNNNSDGDAVINAKQMIQYCQLTYPFLAPKQMSFFQDIFDHD